MKPSNAVTEETRLRISMLFKQDEIGLVEELLRDECGANLPFLANLSSAELDRFRFAALKLSGGDLQRLEAAVKLAKADWRDLLIAADFADDVEAHLSWWPSST